MSLHYTGKHEPTEIVLSVMLDNHWDHPCRQIEMKFCVVADLQEIVLRFKFYQNRLSSFGAVVGSKFSLSHWFGRSIDLAKSIGNGKFRPPQLRNCLTNFDEIRTSELPPKSSHHAKFHFDLTKWVVSANTQHDWFRLKKTHFSAFAVYSEFLTSHSTHIEVISGMKNEGLQL